MAKRFFYPSKTCWALLPLFLLLLASCSDDDDTLATEQPVVEDNLAGANPNKGSEGTVVMEEGNSGATYSGEIDYRILKPVLSSELRLKGNYSISFHADVKPLHGFKSTNDEAKDYYVVTLRTTVESKGMYHGNTYKKYGGTKARYCGYFLRSLDVKANLTDANGNVPKGTIFVSTPKPKTLESATTYTSGYSYGITGGLTAGTNYGASLKGGLTLESSTTRTITDCEIASRSNSPTVFYEYRINNLPKYNKNISISNPPDISISTATFYNEWIWAVPTKDRDDNTEYKMVIDISNFVYGAAHFYSTGADFKSEKFPIPDKKITLSLAKPNRWQTGLLTFSNKVDNTYLTNIVVTGNNKTFSSKSHFGIDESYEVYLPVGEYSLSCDVRQNKELKSYIYDRKITVREYETTKHNSSETDFILKK